MKDEQLTVYNRARSMYTVRSKIAHGDKIDANEEAAATLIVENWTPEAEGLARLCLRRLLEKNLLALFDSKKRHETLLTELLFVPKLDDALNCIDKGHGAEP